MNLTQDMKDLLVFLERHEVSYAVVGGFAVNYYGYPRLTQDFDILVDPTLDNAQRLLRALSDFGFGQAGLTLDFFTRPGAALHLGVEPNRIDILTSLVGAETALIVRSARKVDIGGVPFALIDRQDLITCKRASNRLKDQADAEELLAMELKTDQA